MATKRKPGRLGVVDGGRAERTPPPSAETQAILNEVRQEVRQVLEEMTNRIVDAFAPLVEQVVREQGRDDAGPGREDLGGARTGAYQMIMDQLAPEIQAKLEAGWRVKPIWRHYNALGQVPFGVDTFVKECRRLGLVGQAKKRGSAEEAEESHIRTKAAPRQRRRGS